MATMRGNAGGYGMGAPAYGGMNEPQQEGNALDAIRQHTSKIEDLLDSAAEPIKPCVPIFILLEKTAWQGHCGMCS